MKIISWNVNGLRAAEKKGFGAWFLAQDADIVCLQEIKAREEQLGEGLKFDGYGFALSCAERRGYSGVGVYYRERPLEIREGLEDDRYNTEGRVLRLTFENFILYNVYFPNGGDPSRRGYKNGFNEALLAEVSALQKQGARVIICGDVNIAHCPIDLKNPKSNEKTSGFLPEERRYLDRLLAAGFVDTFRRLHPQETAYSWWSYRFNARSLNAGWRLDYFFVTENVMPDVTGAGIDSAVMGSDHCPVWLELETKK